MIAVTTFAVVPARQVDTDSFAITLHKAIGTLINICLAPLSSEALLADTGVGGRAGPSIQTQAITHSFAHSAIAGEAWPTGAAMPPHHVEAESILITAVEATLTLIMLCAGVVIDPDVTSEADTHEGAWRVHTHRIFPAVVFTLRTLINIFTVCIVIT